MWEQGEVTYRIVSVEGAGLPGFMIKKNPKSLSILFFA